MSCKRCLGTGKIPDHMGGGWTDEICPDCRGRPVVDRDAGSDVGPDADAAWRVSVTLGRYNNSASLRSALQINGIQVLGPGDSLLHCMRFSSGTYNSFDLVKVTDTELGFTSPYDPYELLDAAKREGYGWCDDECGPLLRLKYRGGDNLVLGMIPTQNLDRRFAVFTLGQDQRSGLWLSASLMLRHSKWFPGREWVFLEKQ